MPADKTPGQVAFRAHQKAFSQTRPGFRLRTWGEFPDDIHAVWEKTARVVLTLAEPVIAAAVSDMGRVRDIRKVLAEWGSNPTKVMSKWTYFSANDVIDAIEDLLASPTPEESKDGE